MPDPTGPVRTATYQPHPSAAPDPVLSLLSAWYAARAAGEDPTPEELCPGDPDLWGELRRRIEAVRGMDALAAGRAAAGSTVPGDVRPVVAADPPAAGGGRYLLRGEIARGGMGVVYAARDAALNREVAVKVLHDRLRDRPGAARRFAEEASIAAQLQHPGVPPVYDLGTLADGRPFLAMKLIKGRTLDDLLADRPDPTRLAALFEGVCQAVAYAHSKGVVHRDLKPANVMVGAFGEVQVMDWGLAKVLGAAQGAPPPGTPAADSVVETDRDPDDQTRTGSVLGTLRYMPPEQARGELGRVDARADVFSLGAVLCELLTGDPPYTGTPAEVRARAALGHLDEAFARLDACGADPELIALAKRCLAADPAARPADAGAVAAAVAAHRAGVADRLRRAEVERAAEAARAAEATARAAAEAAAAREANARAAEQRKRRRAQAALSAAVLALLAGGGAAAWGVADARRAREYEGRLREERQAALREGIRAAIGEAEAAYARSAEDAARWPEAKLAAGRAVALAEAGDADPDQAAAARELARDFALLDRLERARIRRCGMPDCKFDAHEDPSRAFREYGVDVAALPAEAAAARLGGRAVTRDLAAALDDWAWTLAAGRAGAYGDVGRLLDVADRIDPDPDRVRLRAAVRGPLADHVAGLKELAAGDAALGHHPATVVLLANALVAGGAAEDGIRLLERAVRRHPGNFWVTQKLAEHLTQAADPPRHREGLQYHQAALALRPGDMVVHQNLAICYFGLFDAGRAADHLTMALEADPDHPVLLHTMGSFCLRTGRRTEAEEWFRKAAALDPPFAMSLNELGGLALRRGDVAGARRLFLEMRAAVPALEEAYREQGYRLAANNLLGLGLRRDGDACWAAAEAIRPARAKDRLDYAETLARTGRRGEALRELERVVKDDPRAGPAWDRLAGVRFAAGEYGAAVRLYESGMAGSPRYAAEPRTGFRYNAACAAARAAAGDGADPPPPAERDRLRSRALDWLAADQAAWTRLLAAPPPPPPATGADSPAARAARMESEMTLAMGRRRLARVLADPDLAGVRHPMAMAFLPAAERDRWRALWADARRLRDRAAGPRG